MKCSNCNHENRNGIKFCEECGTELPQITQQTCPECSHENREGVKFCEECGAVLAAKKPKTKKSHFCPQCGHENRAGINFCEECGTALTSAPAPTPAPAPRYVQPAAPVQPPAPAQHYYAAPARKRRTWLWAVGGGLLAVLLCCFSYVLLPAPPVSGDTALPDFVDNAWEEVVEGRESYQKQGGLLGAVITGVEAIIPNPVEDAVGRVVGGIVKAPVDKPPGQAPPDGEFPEECGGVITCRGFDRDLCELCGNEWKDFGDEQYCWCGGGGQYTDKRWCEEFIQGRWVEEEQRCTLLPDEQDGLQQVSRCSNITFKGGDWEEYRDFKKACIEKDGFEDHFGEGDDEIAYCLCPQNSIIKNDCDFFGDSFAQDKDLDFRCSAKENDCVMTMKPADILDVDAQFPDMLLRLKDGTILNSEYVDAPEGQPSNQTTGGGGCQANFKVLWCRFPYKAGVDEDDVADMFLCHNQCCVNLKKKEDEGFFGLTDGGRCPDPSAFEVDNFRLNYGLITMDMIKEGGWEESSIGGTINDALDRKWSAMDCERDSSDKTIMSCTSTDSGITIRTGSASFIFDDSTFGVSCGAELDFDFSLPPWAPPTDKGCSPGYHSCPGGFCCPDGYSCVPGGCS